MTNYDHSAELRSPGQPQARLREHACIASESDPERFANSQGSLDRRLDQALEETFPASDPVSVVIS